MKDLLYNYLKEQSESIYLSRKLKHQIKEHLKDEDEWPIHIQFLIDVKHKTNIVSVNGRYNFEYRVEFWQNNKILWKKSLHKTTFWVELPYTGEIEKHPPLPEKLKKFKQNSLFFDFRTEEEFEYICKELKNYFQGKKGRAKLASILKYSDRK